MKSEAVFTQIQGLCFFFWESFDKMSFPAGAATVVFTLADKFCWDAYVQDVHNLIVHAVRPVHVLWDLRGMTGMPPMAVVLKQAHLMHTEKEAIRRNILTNTVLLRSVALKKTLVWIFENIYAPQNPTNIFTAEEWRLRA